MSRLEIECHHRYATGFELSARFAVDRGVTALFGPSGSGKSTTLQIIAGLLRPARGRIQLGERTLLCTASKVCLPPEQRRIGIVFQSHLLFPHLSIKQNLLYGAKPKSISETEFRRIVEILELADLLDRHPATLSGGQCQRTALGRAILCHPELLLMDEPLSALDEDLKHRVITYVERIVAEFHIPTLFVSHDQADVRRIANHVIIIQNGRVTESGPTRETLDSAVIRRFHTHTGPVNFLRVDRVTSVNSHTEGYVSGQSFRLPSDMRISGTTQHIRFLPCDVVVSNHRVAGISVRNQLDGRVKEIVDTNQRVFVAINVGQLCWAELTPEAIRELDLAVGSEVVCLIKSSAVHPAD